MVILLYTFPNKSKSKNEQLTIHILQFNFLLYHQCNISVIQKIISFQQDNATTMTRQIKFLLKFDLLIQISKQTVLARDSSKINE